MSARRVRIILKARVVVCAVLVALGSARSGGQDVFLGLRLATQEQMLGIPLASLPFSGTELPSTVDLSADLPPPGQQGRQNSCVAWSLAYALKSYHEHREEQWQLIDGSGQPNLACVFSPAFLYNQINNGRDGGSYMRDGLNLLSEQGAALWHDMPYNPDDYQARPPPAAVANARRYRIDYWRRVNVADPREVKVQLHAGYPVIIGATVDDGFVHQGWGETWNTRGVPKGGHAMVVVGYDDARGAFKVLNSWGREWSESGYGWIGYQLFSEVVNEGYVAKDAANGSPPVTNQDPTAPVRPGGDLQFRIVGVQHNVQTATGNFMAIEGWGRIPPGRGSWGQVVVYFFFDAGGGAKGPPVRAMFTNFADAYGNAATGTPGFGIGPAGVEGPWTVYIPYAAFQTGYGWTTAPNGQPYYQPGIVSLVAEAVHFIDNFGVMTGGTVPFTITY